MYKYTYQFIDIRFFGYIGARGSYMNALKFHSLLNLYNMELRDDRQKLFPI